MKTVADMAAMNNIIWCGIVCDSHGVAHAFDGEMWRALAPTPQYYPQLITASSGASMEDVIELLGDDVYGIKDSYAALDMSVCGFETLLEAQWIYHEPMQHTSYPSACRVIVTEQELEVWNEVSGLNGIILPELLSHPSVAVYLIEQNACKIGFIASLGAGAVGVSNVCCSPTGRLPNDLWRDIVKTLAADFPGIPVVGYERGKELRAALACGWQAIGPLKVWVRSSK
jgi:hypothetical protein